MQLEYTSVIASFMTFILALMAWLNRHYQKRMQTALGLLMLSLSAASLNNFFMQQLTNIDTYRVWLRFAILLNSLEFFMIVYFIFVLTGYIDRMDEKIAGLSLGFYFKSLAPILAIGILILGFSDLFVTRIYKNPEGIIEMQYSPWMFPIESIALFFVFIVILLLYKSYIKAPNGHYKAFLKSISIGLFIILLSGPVLGILLPLTGFESGPLVDVSIVVAAVIFYLSINQYQYSTITDLNVSLEHKVEERTRHLHEAQAQLVQSEKMASMGRLIAGFAHEINNPIGAVQSTNSTLSSSINKLKDTLTEPDSDSKTTQLQKLLNVMNDLVRVNGEGAKRVGDMVQKMKSFIQLDEGERQRIDIHEGIDTTIELFSARSDNQFEFTKDYADLPLIACYPAKLNQVYWQLFDNAKKAMNGNGEIQIKTAVHDSYITIEIADTGKGIEEKDLAHIFEPGFTNWSVGVGVGLGLSICYQIIQEHKGNLTVSSELNKGSTFKIELPLNN